MFNFHFSTLHQIELICIYSNKQYGNHIVKTLQKYENVGLPSLNDL